MNRVSHYLSIIMLLLTFCAEGIAQTVQPDAERIIYVNKNVIGSNGSGDSWANAIPELADALKWANANKTSGLWSAATPLKIYVAKGTYKPMYTPEDGKDFSADAQYARDRTFLMVKDVELYGGFDPANGKTALTDRILPGKDGTNADGTILSGDLNGDDAVVTTPGQGAAPITGNAENAYHVVLAASDTENVAVKLDGFGITGANASSSSSIFVNGRSAYRSSGGGITSFFSSSSSVTLSNSSVYNNSSSSGGGICSFSSSSSSSSSSSVTLSNSSVYNNSSTGDGGGIYSFSASSSFTSSSVTLSNSSVYNNSSSGNGGGICSSSSSSSSVTLSNSSVYNNSSSGNGGGIFSSSSSFSTVTLINSSVYNNSSRGAGGGIYSSSSSSSVTLSNSSVYNNSSSSSSGGGIFSRSSSSSSSSSSVTLNNSSVYNNSSSGDGGGIYSASSFSSSSSSEITLNNSTLAGNTGTSYVYFHGGGTKKFTVRNSLIYGNAKSTTDNSNSNLSANTGNIAKDIRFSLVQDIDVTISADPGDIRNNNLDGTVAYTNLFMDAAAGDYALVNNSPAIDAGSNALYGGDLGNDLDLAGNPRLSGCKIDIGAYENQSNQGELCFIPDANKILYVNKHVNGGNGSGDSWANAIPELADALKWANANKGNGLWSEADPLKIYVAKGIYKPMYTPEDGKDFSAGAQYARDRTFLMVKDVELYGGFDPANGKTELTDRILPSKDGTNADGTILSGDLNGNDTYGNTPDQGAAPIRGNGENVYHVIVAASDTESVAVKLDGFGIIGGNANAPSPSRIKIEGQSVDRHSGGGIYSRSFSSSSSSVTLSSSSVYNNSSSREGGGIYSYSNSSSSVTLSSSSVYNNSSNNSTAPGGGIHSYSNSSSSSVTLSSSSVYNNSSIGTGAGIYSSSSSSSSVTLSNSSVHNNRSSSRAGGGIYSKSSSSSSVTLSSSAVYNNSSIGAGGGISSSSYSSSSVTLSNSSVYNNSSNVNNVNFGAGGGIYSSSSTSLVTLSNSSVYNNSISGNISTSGVGGGIYSSSSSSNEVKLYNSTLAGNKAPWYAFFDGGGAKKFTVYNSLVYGNVKSTTDNSNSSLSIGASSIPKDIQYSLVQDIDATISADPGDIRNNNLDGTVAYTNLFMDATAGDYKLVNNSPAIDAGSNALYDGDLGNDLDLAGHPRLSGCKIDIGAYEFQGEQINYDNVVFEDLDVAYNGSTHTIIATNLPQGVTPSYKIKDALGAVVTEAVNVGTYTITATLSGCGPDKELTATLKIEAATLTVTAASGQSKVYGDTDPVLTYTVSGYQGTDDNSVLSGALSRTVGEDVGVYPIGQGDLSGGTNYDIDFTGADFAIAKATLTVTAASGQRKVYGGADPVLIYTVSGYQGTDDNSILSGALSRTVGEDVGVYPIGQGDLSGGTNYDIDFTGADFAIAKATLTVTAASGQRKVYGEADPVLTYTVSGYQGTDDNSILSGALSRTVGEDVGVYPIGQGDLSGGTNYAIDFTGADFAIAKATLTVTAASGQGKVYGDTDPVLTYTVSGYQGTDDNSILSGALSRTVGEDVGVYPIGQGDLSGGTNYAIDFTGADFAIAKATLTVTAASGQRKMYGEADPVLTYTVSGYQGTDDNSILSGALNRTVGEDVGVYPIGQGDLSAGTNYAIDFTGADFAIAKATLTVTAASGQGKVYGDTDPVLTYTVSGYQGTDDNSILSGALSRTVGEDVGVYPIGQGTFSAGANYDIVFVSADFEITKATLTVTAVSGQRKVYGEADPVLIYTVSGYQGTDDNSILSGALSRTVGEDVGVYPIGQGDLSGGTNYDIDFTGADFAITKAVLPAFTFADASFVYDGTAKSLKATGLPVGATVSGYTNNEQTEAGEYVVKASIDGGRNYENGSQTAKLTIEKAALPMFTFADASFVYDGTVKSLKAIGLPAGTTVSSYANNGQTEAGEYTVTAVIDGGNNYEGGSQTAKLTITKAALPLFTFTDASFVYDGTSRSLKASGLTAGATVSYENNGQTEAGEYTVTAVIDGGNNYESGSQTAKLTITKASIAGVTFADASFTYDGTVKSLVIAGGLPVGAKISYENNKQTEAGEYLVTAVIDGGNNYEGDSQTAKLTITKASIAGVTFADASFTYDGTVKSLVIAGTLPVGAQVSYENNKQTEAGEYTVTAVIDGGNNYEGGSQTAKLTIMKAVLPAFIFADGSFVYDGTVKSLIITNLPAGLTATYSNNDHIDAGEYMVTVKVDGGKNYIDASTKTAKLRISPLQQVLSFTPISAQYRDAGTVQLDITSNSDLPIQVFSDNLLVAEVQGTSELLIKGVGRSVIRVEQAGGPNHVAAQAVEQLLEVVNDRGARLPVRVHPAVSPNGDGINEFLRIEGIEQYPENKFVVFDANGAVIQRFEGYDNASTIFDGSKVGRPVPNGTYFYVLEVKIAGKWEYDKGYFVVRK